MTRPAIQAERRAWTTGPVGLGLLVALAIAQGVVWALGLPDGQPATTAFAWRAVLLFGLQVAAIAIAWRRRDRWALGVVLVAAVGFRLASLAWQPGLSSDLYRYVWDGRVQLHGYSPYAAPPAAAELAPLRDDVIWPRINRPGAITVYPPGAQLAFLTLARLGGDSTFAVRLAAGSAELLALGLLLLWRRRRRLSVGHVIIYAWSPLLIAEVWVSGHVDALVLPLVFAALLLCKQRPGWTGALIGVGTLLKLYPVLLLFAVPRSSRVRTVTVTATVVALGYLPFVLMSGGGALGFLPDYVRSGEDFNAAVRGFLQTGLAPFVAHARELAMALVAAGMAAVCAATALRPPRNPVRGARAIALAFVLLLPTAIHPWYAVWLVPLITLEPSPAALWIVGALPLSYLKYSAAGDVMPAWIPMVEWVPALTLLAWSWRATARHVAPEAA